MGFLTDLVERARRDLAEPPLDDGALLARAAARPRLATSSAALRARRPALIAEVKRASPSAGAIAEGADPVRAGRRLRGRWRGGDLGAHRTRGTSTVRSADLDAVRLAVELPLLRKDFLVHPSQVLEARSHGADAVLLITACPARRRARGDARGGPRPRHGRARRDARRRRAGPGARERRRRDRRERPRPGVARGRRRPRSRASAPYPGRSGRGLRVGHQDARRCRSRGAGGRICHPCRRGPDAGRRPSRGRARADRLEETDRHEFPDRHRRPTGQTRAGASEPTADATCPRC